MQTITFYAYKGGTGRSLMLANAAKYLARLGQRTFCLDLDLEAPGLHHKLQLGSEDDSKEITKGVVDWLTHFRVTGTVADSLRDYTVSIKDEGDREGSITLMPAGAVMSRDYWRQLSAIDWHKLFFSDNPTGIPLFLELQARIEKEFSPDFLLIDARTGITEVGGVATTVLPTCVVCLLLSNRENLEGAREVLRGIQSAPMLPGREPVTLVPVLSRIPEMEKRRPGYEDRLIADIRAFLNAPGNDGESLDVSEVLVLHSEDSLQVDEAIRIGGARTVDQSPLLRDYLRLFSRLIPKEVVAPHLDKLIKTALSHMLEDPEETQAELEALATYSPHSDAFFALMKFYRLRCADSARILQAASRYWELSGDAQNDLLWRTVREHFKFNKSEASSSQAGILVSPDFIEAVWRAHGSDDVDVAMKLTNYYFARARSDRAIDTVERLLARVGDHEPGIIEAINLVIGAEKWDFASSLVDRYRTRLGGHAGFQAAWAKLLIKQGNRTQARQFLESKEFLPAQMQSTNPIMYIRLLKLCERDEELNAALLTLLDRALAERRLTPLLFETHQLFMELGKGHVFAHRAREVLSPGAAKRLLQPLGLEV
ncbi:MAG: KGGVGR-motif variant AAA ATPase [Isosphaeraceae bacterium]